jgi:SAM-dependent methyltransferase
MFCLGCKNTLPPQFIDLGNMPLANSLLNSVEEFRTEKLYPLMLSFCQNCYLVQLAHPVNPDKLYENYIYYSSNSTTFLEHTKAFVKNLAVDFGITPDTKILEIASNDGYLLQYLQPYRAKILGIEPATNLAQVANSRGLPTMNAFFGPDLVNSLDKDYDIIIGNNVLAHAPNINDFLIAVKACLSKEGIVTFEFPYLLRLIDNLEFDTCYHEHVFYYSVIALTKLLKRNGLEIFDIKFSTIHGGSIRIFVKHLESNRSINSIVSYYELIELSRGLDKPLIYDEFAEDIITAEYELLKLCQRLKSQGKTIAAYGAPAKGNVLLNYCGIDHNLIDFTVDISPSKQGKWLPGSHIPILHPDALMERKPNYTLLLAWNFAQEIREQQDEYLSNGGKFIVPIPKSYIIGN